LERIAALESSGFEVKGDRILLQHGEGAASGLVESEYAWKAADGRLTLTPVKNGCGDKVAQTILTSAPGIRRG